MSSWRSLILCIGHLLFQAFFANAQTSYFKQFTISDGLPTNLVYDVFQDTEGYIWFGTEVGVSRFDGRQFTNYSIRDGLTDNEIFFVFEDSKHRKWFLTFNGKLSYFLNDQIYHPGNTPFLQEIQFNDSVLDVLELAVNTIQGSTLNQSLAANADNQRSKGSSVEAISLL